MISTHRRCENLPALDLAALRRARVLQPWQHSTWRWGKEFEANLHVTGDAFDWLEVDIGRHRHNIEFTQTQSGSGRRRWFSCPDCRRACGIVYFFHGRLSCRLCLGLRYASQLEEPQSRTLRRADRIYGRVGGSFPHDFDPDFPPNRNGCGGRSTMTSSNSTRN